MKMPNAYPEFSGFEKNLLKRVTGRLARRLRLSRQDREDIEQELAIYLWQKKDGYDPDHISGSRYETYITRFIEKQALDLQDTFICDPHNSDCNIEHEPGESKRLSRDSSTGPIDKQVILKTELGLVVKKLNPEHSEIVKYLATDLTIPEIAQETGIPYRTVLSRVRRIREIFAANGLSPLAD